MTRVIVKFKNGDHINIAADCIDFRDTFIMAWNGDALVAIVAENEIVSCHISEGILKGA